LLLKTLISIVISAICLVVFLQKTNWSFLISILKNLPFKYLPLLMVIQSVPIAIRAIRWKYMLEPGSKAKFGDLYKVTAIGFMLNNLLPLRPGEFIRPYMLSKKTQIPLSTLLATIVIERIFDLATVLFLFFISINLSLFKNARIIHFCILISGVIIIFFVILLFFLEKLRNYNYILLNFIPLKYQNKVKIQIDHFTGGFICVKNKQNIFWITFYSIVLWLNYTIVIYLLFLIFCINLNFWDAIILNTILVLGISLPSAPGYIGTFHLACAIGLSAFGIDSNTAKGFAIVLWLVGFVSNVIIGTYCLAKEDFSIRSIKKIN